MAFDRKSYMKLYNKKYYQQNKERERARIDKWFRENPERRKELQRISSARYRKENPEKYRKYAREYAREWRKKNPDRVKAQNASQANKKRQKKYRENHKEVISKRSVKYARHKMKVDPLFRLKNVLRARINTALKRRSGSKAHKTMELIGCSIEEYKEHIEKQFKPGMTWENHTKVWEIDHIIPIGNFDLTRPEEQKKAFHYTNTQPLDCKLNRQKQPSRMKV